MNFAYGTGFAATAVMIPFKSSEDLIEIRPSPFGYGLFTLEDIPANTTICEAKGKELSFSDTLSLGDRESHTLQVGINRYILCEPPFLYSNHSCEPNCALNSSLQFFTLENIPKNKELLWDYSTSMYERHWTMQCSCGSKSCRSIVKDFDLLPKRLQQRYLKMNIVLPFIVEQIVKEKNLLATRA